MVVMYFVGLPSNSDKNEKLLMSSIVEGLRLLSKMKKYIPLFLDFRASKNLRNLGRKPFKKKSSKSQVYLLVLTVSKTRITTRSQGTKKTESSTSINLAVIF